MSKTLINSGLVAAMAAALPATIAAAGTTVQTDQASFEADRRRRRALSTATARTSPATRSPAGTTLSSIAVDQHGRRPTSVWR